MFHKTQHLYFTILAVIVSDAVALLFSYALAYLIRISLGGFHSISSYLAILPLLLLFIPLYAAGGLYPGFLLAGSEHLKRLSIATAVGGLFMSGVFFVGQYGILYSRAFLLLFTLLAFICVPLFRHIAKRICGRFAWWGYPVLLLGKSGVSALMAKHLRHMPQLGYRPKGVIVIDDGDIPELSGVMIEKLQSSLGEAAKQLAAFRRECPLITVVLAMNGLDRRRQERLFKLVNSNFRRIIIIPEESFDIRLSVTMTIFCSQMSLSMRQNLLDPYRLHMKRFLELLIILVFSLPTMLVFLLLCLLVRLDSPGPVFYRHKRIGSGGNPLLVWKFRTMHRDADKQLNDYLRSDPHLSKEWMRNQKLKNDPRITRVGRFLRRSSLDELPQLLNVLAGDMSLIGPRPIVEEEVERYGETFDLYKRVKPGMTGLWQVSGRSGVGYESRVALDETYIANWSVWLDIYIMIRTLPAVITASGAC